MYRFCAQKIIELKSFHQNKSTDERVIQKRKDFLNIIKNGNVFYESNSKQIALAYRTGRLPAWRQIFKIFILL